MAVIASSRHSPVRVLPDLFLLVLFLPFLSFFDFFADLFFLFFLPFFFPFLPLLDFFADLFFLLFFFPASASASLASLEEATSSEREFSSLFSAEARTAKATRRPNKMRQIFLFILISH